MCRRIPLTFRPEAHARGPRTEPGTQRRGGVTGKPVALLPERSLAVQAGASPANRCGEAGAADTGEPGKKNGPLPLAGGLKIALFHGREIQTGVVSAVSAKYTKVYKKFL